MQKPKYYLSHSNLILRLGSALLAYSILASTPAALAVDHSWTGGSAVWNSPGGWNPPTVPTSADVVTFPDLGVGYSVTSSINLDYQAASVTISTPDSFQLSAPFTGQVLSLASGDLTRTSAAAATQNLSLPVLMNANGLWNINGTGQLNVVAIQQSVAGLTFTKTGTGMLNITGTSTYTGVTNVNAGILRVNTNSLGSGNVTVANGATLQITNNVDRQLTLNGSGVGGDGALVPTSGSLTWSGDITLFTNSAIGTTSFAALTISGAITDGLLSRSLTKVGLGSLTLTAANTYDGGTTVSEGSLLLNHNTAAGSGSITVASGATVVPGDGRTIGNFISLNGTGDAGHGALLGVDGLAIWNGNINLQSNSAIGSDTGELRILGNIGGAFALTKVGTTGVVTIAANNNITGSLLITEGTLKARNPFATSATATTVSAGATLAVQETIANSGINISRPVSLNGTGDGGGGALRNISSNNTWSGAVTLQSSSSIGVDAGQLTISGAIGGAFALTKIGPGALLISNTGNSYGNTIVDDGTLIVGNSNALPAAGTLTVHSGGTAQVGGAATFSRNFVLNGPGFNSGGALRSSSGLVNWNNGLTLQSDSAIGVDAGELRMVGGIAGSFALTKVGLGKLTFPTANSYTGKTDVGAGVLSLEHIGGIPGGNVTTVLDGAALEVRGGIAPTGELRLNGMGVLSAGALRNPAGTNTWAGPITLQSDAAIGADAGTQLTVSGVISDVGVGASLAKVGAGTLILTGTNTYRGGTAINGGTLSISANDQLGAASGPVAANNGGKLLVSANMTSGRTFNLSTGSIQVNSGATLTYTNATVSGGFLRGPGTHAIGVNSTFSGVTALNGTNITQGSPTTLVNFTNAGTLTSLAALTWDGGFNTSAGVINVNNAFNTQAFENDGVITVFPGGTITNTASPLVSGGGARITINPGGTVSAGPSFELNGSLLVNNGTVTGTTNVNYGSLAKGSGVYGTVNVNDGGKFSPGNSPGLVTTGSTTWNSGGSYVVEIANALSDAGHDFWLVDGQLNLIASSQHPFTIALASLDGLIFDPTHDYSLPILRASDGIVGFDASELILNLSAFKNSLDAGHFSIDATATYLVINFSAVPELTALSLLGTTCLLAVFRRSRKEKR